MASLIDSLIDDLDKENIEYEKLLELSKDKTSAIVKGDVEHLQEVFVKEQKLIDSINDVEKKRIADVADICNVLHLPAEEIKVEQIVGILEKRPKEHDALQEAYLKLKRTIEQLSKINDNNKMLLKESMDMIEFELNLAKNAVMAPQTGTYGKGAYEDQSMAGARGFDAKQ
ncbi:MAG: flagellar protein FlgN [Eubacteriales bacterium]|nr:flagellar protein FlgN [Eubacteriales bacterium]